MAKIYVKVSDIPLTKTRKELIQKFLQGNAYTTYSDEDCTIIQCENGKFRSVTEIFEIILSRFPKTSFNAVLGIIGILIRNNANFVMVWCTQVNKVVLKFASNSELNYISQYSKSNYYDKKGVDDYSLKDYEEIIIKLKTN